MRKEFLLTKVTHLLDRLSPPRSISANQEAQAQEIDLIVSVLSKYAPQSGYETWWPEFEARLLENHQTRAWPTVFEIKAACDAGKRKADPSLVQSELEMRAIEWLENHKTAHPVFNTPDITEEVVKRGVFPDYRLARFRGFTLSDSQAEIARKQRPSREEWEHHVTVMARLRGCTYDEAHAIEAREVSEGELPEHLTRGGAA